MISGSPGDHVSWWTGSCSSSQLLAGMKTGLPSSSMPSRTGGTVALTLARGQSFPVAR
jgi:hypothetical protein